MDKNFFRQVRILDGGMGQELLARGLNPQGLYGVQKLYWKKKSFTYRRNL